jgi:hypothetical protein
MAIHPASETGQERLHREFQRKTARGVPDVESAGPYRRLSRATKVPHEDHQGKNSNKKADRAERCETGETISHPKVPFPSDA